jgi:uracil-DNA glycosylase
MNDTHDMPHRLATLLAWYRDMGVTAALDDTPTDWCARGDRAPGASFDMPERWQSVVRETVASRPASSHQNAQPFGREPDATRARVAPTLSSPPARRAPLPTDVPNRTLPPSNVRTFDNTAAPTLAPAAAITANTLAELAAALATFEGCGLKATAKNICIYRGAERARVMLIGEAPGRDEDLSGFPFAGESGQLLDRMLSAIALDPAEVHLTNVVYWRPPGNRTPTAQEVQACAPFLARQIELVAPEVILLLGGVSAKAMFSTEDTIMKVRGKWRDIQSAGRTIRALATLHPGQVLRTPSYKRRVWQDLLTFKAGFGSR